MINGIIDALGPDGWAILLGAVGLILALVAAIMLRAEQHKPDPLARLERPDTPGADQPRTPQMLREAKQSQLEKLAPYLEPQNQAQFSAARLRLLQAGYSGRNAITLYNLAQIIGLVVGAIGGGIGLLLTPTPLDTLSMLAMVMLPAALLYLLPVYWVERSRQARQQQILDGFPDALDLMLICVEAGQSLDQAILRVAEELEAGYPALAQEFAIISSEIRAGKDRITVLRDMGARAAVPDISSFVTVLIQSQNFGTPISDALRVYAAEMRDKRMMRAEEKANILPTKLTMGTMMFTVPPLLVILIGPSIYDIYVNLIAGGG